MKKYLSITCIVAVSLLGLLIGERLSQAVIVPKPRDEIICHMDHRNVMPVFELGFITPRGTLIAGKEIFADILEQAEVVGLSKKDELGLRNLADEYEKRSWPLFVELSRVLAPLHLYGLEPGEVREIIGKARAISEKIDELWLTAFYKATPFLEDEKVVAKYNKWFESKYPIHPEKIFDDEELMLLHHKYGN